MRLQLVQEHLLSWKLTSGGLQTSPGYAHTPTGQKRQRLPAEDSHRTKIPRLCHPSEPTSYPRRESPPMAAPRPDGYFGESHARPGKFNTPAGVCVDLRHPRPNSTPSSRPADVHSRTSRSLPKPWTTTAPPPNPCKNDYCRTVPDVPYRS